MQIGENASQAQSVKAVTLASATTTNGTAVDCSGYDETTWIADFGTLTGAGCTGAVTVEESATSGGSYAAITGAAFANVTASNDEATYLGRTRVNPAKPFQRASIVSSGTVTTLPVSVSVLRHKSNGLRHPVATPSFQVTAI